MTTVICSDKYLIADHRLTVNRSSYDVPLRGLNDSNYVPVPSSEMPRLDSASKIQLVDFDLFIEPGNEEEARIKAFAWAGSSGDWALFWMHLKQYVNSFGGKPDIIKFHSFYGETNKNDVGYVAILDNGQRLQSYINGQNRTTHHYSKGTPCIGIGSGWELVNKSPFNLKDMSIELLFKLSCLHDKATSPSYSVYGLEENQLFDFVLEPLEKRMKWLEEVLPYWDVEKAVRACPASFL